MKNYIKEINEIYQQISDIKSKECIMDYDDKTKLINNLEHKANLVLKTQITLASAGVNMCKEE
jgi:hypothetical protein